MKRKTKGWDDARRAAQAERCRKNRPSDHATGPKTPAGKAAVSRNGYKHGFYAAEMAQIRRLLRLQRAFLKALMN